MARVCTHCAGPPDDWTKSGPSGPQLWNGFYSNVLSNSSAVTAYRAKLFQAWSLLTEAQADCNTTANKFDIADVGREYLNTAVCLDALGDLAHAWNTSDGTALRSAGQRLVASVLEIDELLSSQQGFLIGAWIQRARAMGHSADEEALMELNARAQVTTWYPYTSAPTPGTTWPLLHNIDGYAQKQWGGLSRLSHAPRLNLFVEQLLADHAAGRRHANMSAYLEDFIKHAVAFENARYNASELPAVEVGSTVAIAQRLQAKYSGATAAG